jgi:hypothetical protein
MTPEEIQTHYRNVFGSEEGRIVLGDLLTLCHFGETLDPNDAACVATYNLGVVILRMAGGLDLIYGQLGLLPRKD